METYRTEEEQVEAIKKWWQDNGKSTVIGIALALGLVFGWKGWQGHQDQRAADASVIFDNLLQADKAVQKDGSKLGTAKHLADSLKSEFASSSYAQFAALMLAKYAVNAGDYDGAEAELVWVLSKKPDLELAGQAHLRLAHIKLAQQDYAAASAELDSVSGYTAEVAELRGDIALAQGDKVVALSQYQQALLLNRSAELPVNNPLLPLKIGQLQSLETAAATGQGEQP